MELLTEFPHLLPQNRQGTVYDGFISVHNRHYRVQINLHVPGQLSEASVSCDWKLQHILRRYEHIIKQRLQQCSTLHDFLIELRSIIERQLEQEEKDLGQTGVFQVCEQLLADLEQLGWERLVYIDPSFQEIHLQLMDDGNRKHVLKVQLSNEYPKEKPKCLTELPAKFEVHWTASSHLQDIYSQFHHIVSLYQEFWDMMEEIDRNTWVLEPEKPNYSAVHRRLAISSGASVQIAVDPKHPRVLPECRFLGADQAVSPLRESMGKNIQFWNEDRSLLDNLQMLLGITFPSPSNSKKEDFSVECGICYAYRLEMEIPNEVCNDARCGQSYHQSCLYEWLRALPSSRQSFNTIFGECPYCEKNC
ncbi:hypothetical protein CHS0354_041597 [Potamilus streckersoni]|uniref:RING-type domain-containing protein n=1 Tax=Potamilus streckersoni TaxID=2493646 RepID=A0AAE0VWF5_9BIVA|nr:hypothetical protein CHS0354_041597 [Potamilus streckersoni]